MIEVDTIKLHRHIDIVRCHLGLTWEAVADICGVKAAGLSRLKSGGKPTADAFLTLVDWLGVSADEFVKQPDETGQVRNTDELVDQALMNAAHLLSEEHGGQGLSMALSMFMAERQGRPASPAGLHPALDETTDNTGHWEQGLVMLYYRPAIVFTPGGELRNEPEDLSQLVCEVDRAMNASHFGGGIFLELLEPKAEEMVP